jgi:prepilin-type processing-associated H-X9-DG protein
MKTSCSRQRNRGLTMLEAVVVIFSLFILIALLLPALGAAASKRKTIGCINHLEQTGMSFRVWEGDHHDKYPMELSVTNGGAMEAVLGGNPAMVFQVMSNELSSPNILVCPADKTRWPVPNFSFRLTSRNISYFVSPDASESNPQALLAGDDNFAIHGVRVKSGLLELSSNNPAIWTPDRHGFRGNVALADGSVQAINNSNLKYYWLNSSNAPSTRLAIP